MEQTNAFFRNIILQYYFTNFNFFYHLKGEDASQFSLSKAIELTTADIVPRLTKELVTDVVLVSMLFLPRSMPVQFQETFTPIAAAGSSLQVDHLGRLMATQMTNAGIGVGIDRAKEVRKVFGIIYNCFYYVLLLSQIIDSCSKCLNLL